MDVRTLERSTLDDRGPSEIRRRTEVKRRKGEGGRVPSSPFPLFSSAPPGWVGVNVLTFQRSKVLTVLLVLTVGVACKIA